MSYKKQELVDKEFDEKFPLIKQTGHEEVEGTFFHEEDRAAVKEFIANQRKKDLESVKETLDGMTVSSSKEFEAGYKMAIEDMKDRIKLQSLNK